MSSPVSDRRQLYVNISHCMPPAQESLKLDPKADDTAQKVAAVFTALYNSIAIFIKSSPQAFSDIESGIGKAQDLFLEAAAKLKDNEAVRERLESLEAQLGNWRISRGGQTHPSSLCRSDIGMGVLLTWTPPSLDGSDE